MILREYLNKLARGKLSNLSLASGGFIRDDSVYKVVDALNEGLNRIYTALPIKTNEVHLLYSPEVKKYTLSSEHSVSKGIDPLTFYVKDGEYAPFKDNILTILSIKDNLGNILPTNTPDHPSSVSISYPNILGIPLLDEKVTELTILYKETPQFLDEKSFESEIEIPDNLQGALLNYAAYLIHNDMNTQEAVANAQKYLSEYQAIISQIISENTVQGRVLHSPSKFYSRGFV